MSNQPISDVVAELRELEERTFKAPWHTEIANPVTFICSPGGKVAYAAFDFHSNAVAIAKMRNSLPSILTTLEEAVEVIEFYKNPLSKTNCETDYEFKAREFLTKYRGVSGGDLSPDGASGVPEKNIDEAWSIADKALQSQPTGSERDDNGIVAKNVLY